jgi:hypothetical protein
MGLKATLLAPVLMVAFASCVGDPQQEMPPPAANPVGNSGAAPKAAPGGQTKIEENKAPVIQEIGTQDVRAGLPMSLGVYADDPEGDEPLRYRFSTSNNSIPAQEFENGVLMVDVPQNLQAGTITGQVAVTDAKGQVAIKNFLIKVEAMPQDSALKQTFQQSCNSISDPIMRSACQLGGAIVR